jgi:hypothetical protein
VPIPSDQLGLRPSQRRKELVAFRPDVRAKMHFSQFHSYQSFGDQFFGSRYRKGASWPDFPDIQAADSKQ